MSYGPLPGRTAFPRLTRALSYEDISKKEDKRDSPLPYGTEGRKGGRPSTAVRNREEGEKRGRETLHCRTEQREGRKKERRKEGGRLSAAVRSREVKHSHLRLNTMSDRESVRKSTFSIFP
jgi:hypothetical protein